jgi:hypothetical protein
MEQAKNVREPISKRLRFSVFKRDAFTCQYCGRKPPMVVLEIDHIHPVSQGGKSKSDNLLTACFECNRGKGAGLLSDVPQSLSDRAAVMQEKRDQMSAYSKLLRSIDKLNDKIVDRVEDAFRAHFTSHTFDESFRSSIKQNFINSLPEDRLVYAMDKAASKCNTVYSTTKYFCGICWSMIRGEKRAFEP